MKWILLLMTLASSYSRANSDIQINVNDIDTSKSGNIIVFLFSHDGFPKHHSKALSTQSSQASSTSLTFNFTNVPEEFAIKILHDEDMSGQVSKNWTGIIPAEGLGFSNKARVRFGPPTFKKAKLLITEQKMPINISLIYP